jgi:excisionase family DNA binding protein
MTEIFFTTANLSQMLNVGKTSVKRWTDDGSLKCIRTPGGHRKFRAEDIVEFLRINKYDIPLQSIFGILDNDEGVMRRMIHGREFQSFISVCYSASLKGDKNELLKLFSELYKNGLALPDIFDRILLPTVKKLKDISRTKISQLELKLSLATIINVLTMFSNTIIKPSLKRGDILCIGSDGDVAAIELKATGILLESEGFSVLDFPARLDSPLTLELLILKKPKWVCLWNSQDILAFESLVEAKSIIEIVKSYGGNVLVAGESGFSFSTVESQEKTLNPIARSFQELVGCYRALFKKSPLLFQSLTSSEL